MTRFALRFRMRTPSADRLLPILEVIGTLWPLTPIQGPATDLSAKAPWTVQCPLQGFSPDTILKADESIGNIAFLAWKGVLWYGLTIEHAKAARTQLNPSIRRGPHDSPWVRPLFRQSEPVRI